MRPGPKLAEILKREQSLRYVFKPLLLKLQVLYNVNGGLSLLKESLSNLERQIYRAEDTLAYGNVMKG